MTLVAMEWSETRESVALLADMVAVVSCSDLGCAKSNM
jgi:hypothetical protein